MKLPNAQQMVTVTLLVHDLSWITLHPEFGIPAMILGVTIQSYLTLASFRAHSSELCCQASLLSWLIGNVIWTLAEYIWDDGYPVGFLANMKFATDLWAAPKWYAVFMFSAMAIQTITCILLISFYVSRWTRWQQQRTVFIPLTNPAEPLVGSLAASSAIAGFIAPLSPIEAYVLVPWLPLRMYYELFTLPWIIMDTLWSYFNLQDVLNAHPSIICLVFSAIFGVAAIVICADCVRRQLAAGERSEASLAMAEAIWVTGNVVWMLEDSITHFKWMKYSAIALFASGPLLVICSVFSTDDAQEEAHTVTPRLLLQVDAACLEAGSATEAMVAAECTPAVPEATKKKRHNSDKARSKTPRLMKRVTVLPKGLSDKTPNFSQLVARLALRAAKEPEKSIALLDLGHINKKLAEWRTLLPNVHPYYSLRGQGDKKILQLLGQEHCSFSCATAEEVSRVLSLGVPPQDVLFCEVPKVKAHVSYVKEKGVELMPFDNAAELRKIAGEFPAARLLLQLAAPKGLSSAPVQFGAPRTEWSNLLAMAVELGLKVVGVSLRSGPGCEEWGLSEDALKDARDVFALATDAGYSMEVLDLGGVDIPGQEFSHIAANIAEKLLKWYPAEAGFATLRVIASPGQLFTRQASMLLTQVIGKVAGPPECPRTQYVLNAGLYGAFASSLTDRTELKPPVPVSLGERERAVHPCCFLGPSRDERDVVLKEASMPELEEGEWILWPSICAQLSAKRSSSSVNEADNSDAEVQPSNSTEVWYYTESGNLPEDLHVH